MSLLGTAQQKKVGFLPQYCHCNFSFQKAWKFFLEESKWGFWERYWESQKCLISAPLLPNMQSKEHLAVTKVWSIPPISCSLLLHSWSWSVCSAQSMLVCFFFKLLLGHNTMLVFKINYLDSELGGFPVRNGQLISTYVLSTEWTSSLKLSAWNPSMFNRER